MKYSTSEHLVSLLLKKSIQAACFWNKLVMYILFQTYLLSFLYKILLQVLEQSFTNPHLFPPH